MYKLKLSEIQREGVRLGLVHDCLPLFLRQGLGKTLISLVIAQKRYELGQVSRVLVVTKVPIIPQWEMDYVKGIELGATFYNMGNTPTKKRVEMLDAVRVKYPLLCSIAELKKQGIFVKSKQHTTKITQTPLTFVVINYEKIALLKRELKNLNFDMLILDESHTIRVRSSLQSKEVTKLSKHIKYKLLLTGTPISKGYQDLFSQYRACLPDVFGTRWQDFEDRYIIKGGFYGYEIKGYKNKAELLEKVQETAYIEQKRPETLPDIKHDYVILDMPKKAKNIYAQYKKDMVAYIKEEINLTKAELQERLRNQHIQFDEKDSYDMLYDKILPLLGLSSSERVITQRLRMHQITGGFLTLDNGEIKYIGSYKLNAVLHLCRIKKTPTLVFCKFTREIDYLTRVLKKHLRVARYDKPRLRKKSLASFQSGELDVLVLQITSGSLGLNLQLADTVIFYSLDYDPTNYLQAITRMDRQGQKNKMNVYILATKDTIEQDIRRTLQNKIKIIETLTKYKLQGIL